MIPKAWWERKYAQSDLPKPEWMWPIISFIRREKKDIFNSYNLFLNEQKKITTTLPHLPILFIHVYKPSPSLDLKRYMIGLFGKGGIVVVLPRFSWSFIEEKMVISLLTPFLVSDAHWNFRSNLHLVMGFGSYCLLWCGWLLLDAS